ncbi:FeoA family protein [Candidatus Synchoanobacter obligatus]|uniref:Ferrous iron transport protein A n=1 Tax=Candidatus Synchoanobacter obligatus TaxID=2919597 RepID=A0ABT1L613_9GAMM|nr:FeoA family protein [Candidatus Synchoanobacter obligatus]MCP8352351.1 ferrous iron transport protein A [Candidatus Synchoanobacter obligatus]
MDKLVSTLALGCEYRIGRILTRENKMRHRFIALGLVPGATLTTCYRLFRGLYWVVSVQHQYVGFHWSELQMLRLYEIAES